MRHEIHETIGQGKNGRSGEEDKEKLVTIMKADIRDYIRPSREKKLERTFPPRAALRESRRMTPAARSRPG